jgi:murein DD-endopeptidase MepM/ murein hydrolase activator NlpD
MNGNWERFYNNKLESNYHLKLCFTMAVLLTAMLVTIFFYNILTLEELNDQSKKQAGYSIESDAQEEENNRENYATDEHEVLKGDSLYSILKRAKVDKAEIMSIIKAGKELKLSRRIKPNTKFTFLYDITIEEGEDLNQESKNLVKIIYYPHKSSRVEITKENGKYFAKELITPLRRVVAKNNARIDEGFLPAARKLGISNNSLIELINAYSHEIDFQRDIRAGDEIKLIYEKFYTEEGEFSHHGPVIYSSLNLSGKEYEIYRYQYRPQKWQYFTAGASSVRGNLLKTPMKVIRISSHFGMRKHPVLGYTKMHKGVDFAAPTGTPVYAAGDGVITELGWKGGYGRYVRVRHRQGLETAYAHNHRFAGDLKRGDKVNQGQIIAYVGKSGKATGSHLHYEVLVNKKHVNPLQFKTTPGIKLAGKDLERFNLFKQQVQEVNENMEFNQEVALEQLKLSQLMNK